MTVKEIPALRAALAVDKSDPSRERLLRKAAQALLESETRECLSMIRP